MQNTLIKKSPVASASAAQRAFVSRPVVRMAPAHATPSNITTQVGEAKVFDFTGSALTNPQDQPKVKLSSGYEMPRLGLGTWKSEEGKVRDAVLYALKAGYRHIDCAAVYGNEKEIGEAFEKAFKDGIVKREDVWITSKLWQPDHESDATVEAAIKKTCSDLRIDYLDLYLVHWPHSTKPGPEIVPPLPDVWASMEKLVDKGLAKSIGISNFSVPKLQQILDKCKIKPAVNQIEGHPYWRNDKIKNFCEENGIHVTAYSPLGSSDSAEMFKRGGLRLLDDKTVKAIAEETGHNIGQVLVRWALQRGTSVLPKSVKPERITSNLDVFSFELTDEQFKKLSNLPQQRMLEGLHMIDERGPYKTVADIWDEEPNYDTPDSANN